MGLAVGHDGVAIVEQRVPARDDLPPEHARAGEPVCRRLHDLEFDRHGFARAFHLGDALRRGGQDSVEVAEGVEEAARQRLDVLPRDGAEEDELKEFVI